MSYDIIMRNNVTGEVICHRLAGLDWHSHTLAWWSRSNGNFGCDCNRGDTWLRAKGFTEEEIDAINEEKPDDEHVWRRDPRVACGHWRYQVIKAILIDGTEIIIDGDGPPPGRDS